MELKKPYKVIIGINVAVFLAMMLTGGTTTLNLIRFGAKYNYGIVLGEYWRFVTPMFIHLDLMHLAFNMTALIVLSRTLDQIFGSKRLILIYFIAGVGGVLLSFAFNDALSAGASGAIFGLMGAHLYLFFRNKSAYRYIFGNDFLILLGINLVYGFIHPSIDTFGHLGGLFAGFFMAAILGIRGEKLFTTKGLIACVCSLALFSSAFVFGINRYVDSAHYYYFMVYDLILKEDYKQATDVLIKAYEKYPNDPSIQQLFKGLQ
jgi:rhomboid protease GluP